VLSVAVHNHYKRLNHQTKHNDVEQATPSVGQPTDVGEPSVPSEAVLREIAYS
jgi:ATP-dependent protease Clp ATPase subunit